MNGRLTRQDDALGLLLPLALSLIIHAAIMGMIGPGGRNSLPLQPTQQRLAARLVAPPPLQPEPEATQSVPDAEIVSEPPPLEPDEAAPSPEPEPTPAPEPARLTLPGLDFYPTNLLTKKPVALREIPPGVLDKYPQTIGGSLILTLWINSAGEVISTHVESSTLPESLSDELADEFRQLPFKPGEIKGMPVNTWMRIEVFPQ